ncbi:helix-turn-helix domain-containing protein [Profundibacter amoris]|uniref:XRE family transcriptional regulator n=1 Tax=Profundibacter amoris TaxID=2171755 RepID=A0A347UEE9_9RHOB|nr:helix-turn-helix transcriptional regulator [Profundibacter amoris]AXX97227.1 XRE family transcriptional regulator [Profundibacter amoris]
MPRLALTGSRIRAKRTETGMKQAALAKKVGISPAYLNLIEHNKRRIGGKLLLDMARELRVEASALSEGAEAALVATLRDAGSRIDSAELARVDDFAGRFPGWAGVMAAQHARIARLEHTVATLTDRLTHDPFLSTSLHEVLSTAAAIRSTASILAGGDAVEPEWQARFQRNLLEDAKRLAEGAGALVSYLDGAGDVESTLKSPQEELESYLEARGYHLPEVEAGEEVEAEGEVAAYLARYRADAVALPLAPFQAAVAEGLDPVQLAARFGVDPATVLRRLASLPEVDGQAPVGLVTCDASGALLFRKPVEGFPMPQFGAACPLWPLYQALLRPQVPIRAVVQQSGQDAPRFLTYAVAQPRVLTGFDGVQVIESVMLVIPENRAGDLGEGAQPVGTSCRICPRAGCAARREVSILAQEV